MPFLSDIILFDLVGHVIYWNQFYDIFMLFLELSLLLKTICQIFFFAMCKKISQWIKIIIKHLVCILEGAHLPVGTKISSKKSCLAKCLRIVLSHESYVKIVFVAFFTSTYSLFGVNT